MDPRNTVNIGDCAMIKTDFANNFPISYPPIDVLGPIDI